MVELDKEIKKLIKALKKQKGKKKDKKARRKTGKTKKPKTSLAEYAKNKMMLDMLSKAQVGSGGIGASSSIQPLRTNYDTETVKRELSDLKEAAKQEKTKAGDELKRLENGLIQYQRQLALDYEQKGNPRMGFVGRGGDLFSDNIEDVYNAVQNQLVELNSEIEALKVQKAEAIKNDEPDKVKKLTIAEDKLTKKVRKVTDDQKKRYAENRLIKQQQKEFERIIQEAEESERIEAQRKLRGERAKERSAKVEEEDEEDEEEEEAEVAEEDQKEEVAEVFKTPANIKTRLRTRKPRAAKEAELFS